VPGSSYSSGGETSPGTIALSLGEKDKGGFFRSDAALAAQYSRADSTGNYRIEGMESTTDYSTSFQPEDDATKSDFTATELAENDLGSGFSSIVSSFHSDGTTQKALQIIAGPAVSNSTPVPNPDIARYYKVEETLPYSSFGTFAFYAKLPPDAALTVALDDGTAVPISSASIGIPADPTRSATWKRYALHYGKGDAAVYVQDGESSGERVSPGATSTSPSLNSTGSRLRISVSGLSANEVAWIDEVALQDSVGSVALLFQGTAAYDNPQLLIGSRDRPLVSDISASAFAQGALNSDSYALGGGSLKAKLGFVGLAINARSTVSADTVSFSAGHSIELPSASFPMKMKDSFDYDPSSGAFGRSDSLALQGGSIASLSLSQKTAWTPATSYLDSGLLLQNWDGAFSLGPSFLTLTLAAGNRALPSGGAAPGTSGNDYASAWLGAFRYMLPQDEQSSSLREVTATLSVKGGGTKEFLKASLGESASPGTTDSGTRSDSDSVRLALPFSLGGINLEPYYLRTWTDRRDVSSTGIVGDAESALGDLSSLPILYLGVPFSELVSASVAADFAAQSAPSGGALPAATYQPEAGLSVSREYGSRWYDLVLPSAVDFYYGRSLVRATDTVTDSSIYSATAKIAAINVFGTMGAYPLGLPFDSDEYLSTFQGNWLQPRDGSASTLNILYHGLATLYAGLADRFDAESKVSIAELPSSLNWTSSLSLALSRRLSRDWLSDLYSLAIRPAAPKNEGEGKSASVASAYLGDLSTREVNIRNTWTLVGGLAGVRSDAASYLPGWSLSEAYETKLTVPERLTLKVDATLSQSLDAASRVFSLGFVLSLNAVISF
jgi:hypothetical protein